MNKRQHFVQRVLSRGHRICNFCGRLLLGKSWFDAMITQCVQFYPGSTDLVTDLISKHEQAFAFPLNQVLCPVCSALRDEIDLKVIAPHMSEYAKQTRYAFAKVYDGPIHWLAEQGLLHIGIKPDEYDGKPQLTYEELTDFIKGLKEKRAEKRAEKKRTEKKRTEKRAEPRMILLGGPDDRHHFAISERNPDTNPDGAGIIITFAVLNEYMAINHENIDTWIVQLAEYAKLPPAKEIVLQSGRSAVPMLAADAVALGKMLKRLPAWVKTGIWPIDIKSDIRWP